MKVNSRYLLGLIMNGSLDRLNRISGESNKSVMRPVSETSSIINFGGYALTTVLVERLLTGFMVTVIIKLEV
jgi:hypothetical protein